MPDLYLESKLGGAAGGGCANKKHKQSPKLSLTKLVPLWRNPRWPKDLTMGRMVRAWLDETNESFRNYYQVSKWLGINFIRIIDNHA
jgi:hypothetical protein